MKFDMGKFFMAVIAVVAGIWAYDQFLGRPRA